MIHLALHIIVPLGVAYLFYRNHWQYTLLILLATMMVDTDHLLADPVYDPLRCSIGFHPLHTLPAIIVYTLCFALPFLLRKKGNAPDLPAVIRLLHLIGLGLLIHMALDGIDCLW